jgi:hypothetical protein
MGIASPIVGTVNDSPNDGGDGIAGSPGGVGMLNGMPGTGIARPSVGTVSDSPILGGVGIDGSPGGVGIENGMPGTGIARANVGGVGILHLDISLLAHALP